MQDWHGVYYVKKVLGPNTYLVQKPGCRKTKVPTDRLKLFNEYLHLNDPNVKITPEEEEDANEDVQDTDQNEELNEAEEAAEEAAA